MTVVKYSSRPTSTCESALQATSASLKLSLMHCGYTLQEMHAYYNGNVQIVPGLLSHNGVS